MHSPNPHLRPHAHPHSHGHSHSHSHGPGHNAHDHAPTQWQTPHLPEGAVEPAPEPDSRKDLDLVEKAFVEGFAVTQDATSFLRLACIPFSAIRSDGTRLKLLRVEQAARVDVGSVTPHIGGDSFRYDPLPAAMTSRRDDLRFVYFDGTGTVGLSLGEVRDLKEDTEA